MSNFIGLVYATLKNEGVDTSGMSTDEAVAKFKELQKKSGGDTGKEGTPAEQRKLEQKGIVDNKEQGGNEQSISSNNEIDYENVVYPKGTSKEYTNMVNEKYQNALPTLEKLGITVKDFGGQKSKEGGFEDNTKELMQKYVFEPFSQKYPNGNNEAWKKEFEPIYNAIDAVEDKLYNDFYIKNN